MDKQKLYIACLEVISSCYRFLDAVANPRTKRIEAEYTVEKVIEATEHLHDCFELHPEQEDYVDWIYDTGSQSFANYVANRYEDTTEWDEVDDCKLDQALYDKALLYDFIEEVEQYIAAQGLNK